MAGGWSSSLPLLLRIDFSPSAAFDKRVSDCQEML
jgi:hypothetical protein